MPVLEWQGWLVGDFIVLVTHLFLILLILFH